MQPNLINLYNKLLKLLKKQTQGTLTIIKIVLIHSRISKNFKLAVFISQSYSNCINIAVYRTVTSN